WMLRSQRAKCRHYSPLVSRVAARVPMSVRTWFPFHFLVISSPLDQRLQHAANDSHPSRAKVVPQLRDRQAVRGAAGAVERLRGDVVFHHDARIQGGEVEFVEAFVDPDFRFEGEAAAIAAQEILGVLEILRTILLP